MAKRDDMKKLMSERLNEAMVELQQARERNANTFSRNSSTPEGEASSDKPGDWSIELPNDVKDAGSEVYTAPTANPSRPRAYTIGYNHNTSTVLIVFRSGAWWQYNDVSPEIWLGLKNSSSTNDYLKTLENNCSSHHAANLDVLSEGAKARLSYTASTASRMQNSSTKIPTWEEVFFPKE